MPAHVPAGMLVVPLACASMYTYYAIRRIAIPGFLGDKERGAFSPGMTMKLLLPFTVIILALTGCTTTHPQFGEYCLYDPDKTPSFHCRTAEPGRDWV